jgi:hypothetical protein
MPRFYKAARLSRRVYPSPEIAMVQVSHKIVAWAALAIGTLISSVNGTPTARAACARPNYGPFVLTAVPIKTPTTSYSLRLTGGGDVSILSVRIILILLIQSLSWSY